MIGIAASGAEKTHRNLAGAARALPSEQAKAVLRASRIVEIELKKEMTAARQMDPFWGVKGGAGDGLAVRSGLTRASVQGGGRIYRSGDTVSAAVGSAQKHLKDHEDGATLSGKSPAGYHRIPTREAQTGAGVDRYAGRSIRDIAGAFLIRTKAGKLWAALARAGRVSLLYLLVKIIRLRPRRIFHRVNERTRPKAVAEVQAGVTAVVNKANA